jgi:hypothetical protein
MTRYSDPNLTYEVLFAGAALAPWEVEENPVLPLLSLEDPAQYSVLQDALVAGWRDVGLQALSEQYQRRYVCDCAEHVLPLYEAKYPNDTRPRQAIDVARRFAFGQASPDELHTAKVAAKAAADAVEAAEWVVWAAAAVVAAADAVEMAAWAGAAVAAADAVEAAAWAWAAEAAVAVSAGRSREENWQADRVRFYYYEVVHG